MEVRILPGTLQGSFAHGFAPIDAALQFIPACGGRDQAKSVLAQVEVIRAVVESLLSCRDRPVHHPAMALTRNRRILIAATAVVGILFVRSLSGHTPGNTLVSFLQTHPSIAAAVRMPFVVVDRESDFDDWFGTIRGSEAGPLQLFESDDPETPSGR